MRWHVYLFGCVRVGFEERTIQYFPTNKAQRLLAYLAYRVGIQHTRDELVELLWPPDPDDWTREPVNARHCLSDTLYSLRRTFAECAGTNEPCPLVAVREVVYLDPQLVDTDFRRLQGLTRQASSQKVLSSKVQLLEEAVRLRIDDPLRDIDDPWTVPARAEVEEMCLTALRELVSAYRSLGKETELIQSARRALRIDPTAEEFARELMSAYFRIGWPSAAQQVYRELVRELGQDVSPETRELMGRLRTAARRLPSFSTAPPARADPVDRLHPCTASDPRTCPVTAVVVTARHGDGDRTALLIAGFEKVAKGAGAVAHILSEDMLYAVFGLLGAGEHDAERAIRTALLMRERARAAGALLRIGVCSGTVHWSERNDGTAFAGNPVLETARRLCQSADPGTVLTCELTRHLAAGRFRFAERRPDPAKAEPHRAYVVLGPISQPDPYRQPRYLHAPMVGRRKEMSRLWAVLREALEGTARAVFLVGEQALGKTRLLQEFKLSIRLSQARRRFPPPCLWLEARCTELHAQTPFFAFADLLKRWSGQNDPRALDGSAPTPDTVVDRLYHNGAVTDEQAKDLSQGLRAGLLSNTEAQEWTSDQALHQVRFALRDIILASARLGPVVLALEDLHWADDHTIDLVLELLSAAEDLPLLMVCTLRPEPGRRATDLPDTAVRKCPGRSAEIHIRELSPEQTYELLHAVLKQEDLPERLKHEIVTKSGGSPFYLQELLHHLIETGRIKREDGRWTAASAGPVGVPPHVKSVVLGRVSRLSTTSARVLRAASVLGTTFDLRAIQAMCGQEEAEKALVALRARRFLIQEGAREYSFCHTLVQQSVYEGIPEALRAELHLRAAGALESVYADRLTGACEELAHHYLRANLPEKALPHLVEAGERARSMCLYDAARSHFTTALAVADEGETDASALHMRMKALIGLGRTLEGVGEVTAAEHHFRDALAVAEKLGVEPRDRVRIHYWIADALFWRGEFQKMKAEAQEGLRLLGDDADSPDAVMMRAMLGIALGNLGREAEWMEYARMNAEVLGRIPYSEEIRRAYSHVIDSIAFSEARPDEAEQWCALYAELAGRERDLRGMADASFRRGAMLLHGGRPAESIAPLRSAAEGFQKIDDIRYLIWCLSNLAEAHLQIGELQSAEEYAVLGLEYAQQIGARRDIARTLLRMGTIRVAQGRYDQGAEDYRGAYAAFSPQPHEYNMALAMTNLALAYLHAGRIDRAEMYARRALTIGELFEMPFAFTLGVLEELGVRIESMFAGLRERHEEMGKWVFRHWKLEGGGPEPIGPLLLDDTFARGTPSGFRWHDPSGEAVCLIRRGLEVRAPNGCDLWHVNLTAPRLCIELNGDFAVQTEIRPSSCRRPAIGGLVIWKDRHNFLRLDRGAWGPYEVRFAGTVSAVGRIVGRGRLGSEKITLRLEREGKEVRALCSANRRLWFMVGRTELPVDDPVEVGLFASGAIDRGIYPGEHKRGTAVRFRRVLLWGDQPRAQQS